MAMTKMVMKEVTGNKSKDSVLFGFSKLSNKINRIPDRQILKDEAEYLSKVGTEWIKKPITRNVVETHFGSIERLSEKALEAYPELFEHVVEDKIFIPRKMEELKEQLRGKAGVIITSALGESAGLLKGSLKTFKNCAKRNKLLPMIIPMNKDDETIPRELLTDTEIHVVYEDVRLNNAICVSAERINPKQQNPITGAGAQIRKNNSSMVFGSPKLYSRPIPCHIRRHPDVAIATGSISLPVYLSKGAIGSGNRKKNVNATNDHNYAAIIIEFDGCDGFFWRNVQIEPATGEFIDLGVRYHSDGGVSLDLPEAQVYGDLHSYVKDTEAFDAALQLATDLKVKRGVMHDICDNFVMSHHKANRHAQKTAMIMTGDNNYGKEINVLVQDIDRLNRVHSAGLDIVPSNHDDMDQRSLEDQSFLKDANNSVFGTMLFPYQVAFNMVCMGKKPMEHMPKYMHLAPEVLKTRFPGIDKGITPLQAMVEMIAPEHPEKVRWWGRNDTWSIGRNEMNNHGDRGSNGAKFSVASARNAVGANISGHSHSPGITGDVFTTGHLTQKEQEYNMGGWSSWQHAVVLVNNNGGKQLITIVDGRYTKFNLKKLHAEAARSSRSRRN
jgi:hypothetical protein